MMNYNLNSYVNKNEADALKEMIFRRVRERSEAINEDFQADIMNIARESFVSKNNPFSQIIENAEKNNKIHAEEIDRSSQSESNLNDAIGFQQRMLKSQVAEQNKNLQSQMAAIAIQNNMYEARSALTNKKSFMGALNFLNSQGAVSLMRTRADKFEIIS